MTQPKKFTELLAGATQGPVHRLTKSQQELYEAMKAGVVCHYMPYMGTFNPNAYYFREDTHKRCTAEAKGLIRRGLVEKFDTDWRGHKLRALALLDGQEQPNKENDHE